MEAEMIVAELDRGDGRIAVGLTDREVTAGGSVDTRVEFTGRDVTWSVQRVRLALTVPYRTEDGFAHATLTDRTVLENETVAPDIVETRDATLTVPRWSPRTIGNVDVVVTVEIVTDRETVTERRHLNVSHPSVDTAFGTMMSLGFVPRGFGCLATDSEERPPYVQRFSFEGYEDSDRAGTDVTMLCRPTADGVELSVGETATCDVPVEYSPEGFSQTIVPDAESEAVEERVAALVE
jgi:sporulation-control protein